MHKILVTGATGFVGSYVSKLLVESGYQVWATKRPTSRLGLLSTVQDNINWRECGLLDYKDMEEIVAQVDAIIHCAAVVSFQPKDVAKMQLVNIEGTHQLINLALQHHIKKFVHISSIAALGRHKNDLEIDETVDWQEGPLNTQYSITKQYSEREVWRGYAEGLDVCILNPSLVIGAGYWDTGSPALYSKVKKGNPFYPIGSTGVVDVRDVAEIALKALETTQSGQKFIVSAENRSYKEILSKVAESIGARKPTIKLNHWLNGILWRADALLSTISSKPRLVSKENLASAAQSATYNNSKSKKTFDHNYRPFAATAQETGAIYEASVRNKQTWGQLDWLYDGDI